MLTGFFFCCRVAFKVQLNRCNVAHTPRLNLQSLGQLFQNTYETHALEVGCFVNQSSPGVTAVTHGVCQPGRIPEELKKKKRHEVLRVSTLNVSLGTDSFDKTDCF